MTAVHLGAAAIWVGGLPFLMLSIRNSDEVVGTQLVRRLVQHMKYETLVLAGLGGIGGGVLLLGAVPYIAATLVATFVIGFSFGAIIVPAQTLFQRETPHELLGRVSSTMTSFVFLAQILGLVLSGVLAEAIGVRTVFFLCAGLAATLVVVGRMLVTDTQAPG